MRRVYPRLFEPAFLPPARPGLPPVPNPRHLHARALPRDRARRGRPRRRAKRRPRPPARRQLPAAAASRPRACASRCARCHRVRGPGRAATGASRSRPPRWPSSRRTRRPASRRGGGYSGPLAYRQGKPMRPDVAQAFDRMAAAAARGRRRARSSRAASAATPSRRACSRANPDPKWVAPPGHVAAPARHRARPRPAGGLRLARAQRGAVRLRASATRGSRGTTATRATPGTRSVGFGPRATATAARSARVVRARAVRAARSRAPRSAGTFGARCSRRSSTPSRTSTRSRGRPAGAQGIAQFMPGTARAYGLRNPFDADAAIDAQAHLMRDLLRRFASVPLALAAYNAGPAPVARVRLRAAVPGDARVRGEDPRPARRRGGADGRRARGEARRVDRLPNFYTKSSVESVRMLHLLRCPSAVLSPCNDS